ncbi:hypothetical protein ABS71_21605 [bacterium SCN 62-11]|nr:PAS domain S-box protein [Candidatus Eremiobacteraeota bacterium]ODT56684.1 MAG: hypothetical protein ABS71_21605 [bacterium SCN 62-11]
MNPRLAQLLQNQRLSPTSPPSEAAWERLLAGLSDLLDDQEEDSFRMEKSLGFHRSEIQSLYQDLLLSRHQLQEVAEQLEQAVVVLDSSGKAVFFNSAAIALTGFSEQDLEADALLAHLGDDWLEALDLNRLLSDGRSFRQQGSLRNRAGRRFQAYFELQPLRRAGQLDGALMFFTEQSEVDTKTREDLTPIRRAGKYIQ